MKILILKPSSLGDVIQALPVLRLLKLHLPNSEIFWWIDSGLASLLEGDPDLAGVVRFERKRWGSPRHWPEAVQSIRWMRQQNFDWVIDLQCLARSGAFAWLANGKLLAGLDEPREGACGFYDVIARRASYHTHAVDWYLSLLPLLGVPVHRDFIWLPERKDVAAGVKEKWKPDGTRWIASQPGARWLNKRWPVAHFAELVRQILARQSDVRFLVLGNKEDELLGDEILRAAPERCWNLAGKTSLLETIELLRLCELMVTNDTGPMHAAAALGRPVISIHGPTEPRRTGAYGQMQTALKHALPCAPCMKSECSWNNQMECLIAISPETVCAHVEAALNSPR